MFSYGSAVIFGLWLCHPTVPRKRTNSGPFFHFFNSVYAALIRDFVALQVARKTTI